MLNPRSYAVLGLAVATASLFGCAATTHETAQDVLTRTNAQEVSREVEADRSLSHKDRDRFLAFLADHEANPDAYVGKNVTEVVNLQKAHEVALRLQMQAEREDNRHRDAIARLISVRIARAPERERSIDFFVHVSNLARKTIAHLEFGLEVHDAAGKRIALAEMRSDARVDGKTQRDVELPMRYVRFGEDAGPMREAAGQTKHYDIVVKEITYADGSDAGYDD